MDSGGTPPLQNLISVMLAPPDNRLFQQPRLGSELAASPIDFRSSLSSRRAADDVGFSLVFVRISRSFRSAERCRLTGIYDPLRKWPPEASWLCVKPIRAKLSALGASEVGYSGYNEESRLRKELYAERVLD